MTGHGKWRKLREKDIINEPLHRWLAWFDPGSRPELVEKVVSMDNAIQKANERQEHILSDEDALRIYEMRQKSQWDFISATNYAREEGLKEGQERGLAEGLAEKQLEIARKMKIRGYLTNEIVEVTGLSPETVEKL